MIRDEQGREMATGLRAKVEEEVRWVDRGECGAVLELVDPPEQWPSTCRPLCAG